MTAVELSALYAKWVTAPDERTFERYLRTAIIRQARREGASLNILRILLMSVPAVGHRKGVCNER